MGKFDRQGSASSVLQRVKPLAKMAMMAAVCWMHLPPAELQADYLYRTASTLVRATQNPTSDNLGNYMYTFDGDYTEHTRFPSGNTQDIGDSYELSASVTVPARGYSEAKAGITLKATVQVPDGFGGYKGETQDVDLNDYNPSMFVDEKTHIIPQFHALAIAHTYGYDPGLQPLPQQAFSAEAEVRFQDQIHIHFSPFAFINPVENLGLVFAVHGSLYAGVSAPVPDVLQPISSVSGYVRFGNDVKVLDQQIGSDIGHASIDWSDTVTSFGEVISFSLLANTFVNTTNVTGYAYETATTDFFNTIDILGIIPYDSEGNVLPSDAITATSEFGFRYSILGTTPLSAVPEPGSITLIGIGAAGLVAGLYRRLRPGDTTSTTSEKPCR